MRQKFITKCVSFFITQCVLLQNATVITKCDDFITKCKSYYKMRHLLQIATVHDIRDCKHYLKMKFSVKDFFSKYEQIRCPLRIYSRKISSFVQ